MIDIEGLVARLKEGYTDYEGKLHPATLKELEAAQALETLVRQRDGWKEKCEAAWERGDKDGMNNIKHHLDMREAQARIAELEGERDAARAGSKAAMKVHIEDQATIARLEANAEKRWEVIEAAKARIAESVESERLALRNNEELRARIAKLEGALSWFADRKNYNHSAGDMARAALKDRPQPAAASECPSGGVPRSDSERP